MDSHFDVLVLGTGLTESITAAALSKAGWKVVHVDSNAYYGADEASLTPEEWFDWSRQKRTKFTSISSSMNTLPQSRRYSLSLSPSVLPATGPLIKSIIASGVAHYGGFKLLDRIAIYSSGMINGVPGSKEDVFKSKDITLIDKRRLMRFLMFAAGDFEETSELEGRTDLPFLDFLKNVFSLNQTLAETISFALAFCTTSSDATLPALKRARQYLRSAGRYGASSFLIGHYGGLGELAQGFCRTCAVSGGTYILGRQISSIDLDDGPAPLYKITLDDFSEIITAELIVSASDHLDLLPAAAKEARASEEESVQVQTAFGIAIIDQPVSFSQNTPSPHPSLDIESEASHEKLPGEKTPTPETLDTGLLVFPPRALPNGQAPGAVSVLINGDSTMSCPQGKCILYLSTSILSTAADAAQTTRDPEALLRPYLNQTLSLITPLCPSSVEPIYTTFYTHNVTSSASMSPGSVVHSRNILLCPPLPPHFALNGDAAAVTAEAIFWEAVKRLARSEDVISFWPPLQPGPDEDEW